MQQSSPLPAFTFRNDLPSLGDMLRLGVSDVAQVIPSAILDEPAIQLPGYGAPLVVADPDLARLVLNDRAGDYVRDKFMRRLFRRTWGEGLAGAEGEAWQAQRKAAAPAFTPRAVANRLERFAAATDDVIGGCGGTQDLVALAARVIARIVFDVLVDGGAAVDRDAIARLMPAYVARIASFGTLDLAPLPERMLDRLRGIDSDPAVQKLRTLATQLADGRSDSPHDDMLALLEGVGPLQDNILGLFPAAMDTTVTGASWTLYLLARHRDWQERVAEEGRAMERDGFALDRMPVTRRVVSEALRLYAPAPILVRSAARSCELGGFPLRKGQTVAILIYAMQRHRQHWQSPDSFDPDRFLPDRYCSSSLSAVRYRPTPVHCGSLRASGDRSAGSALAVAVAGQARRTFAGGFAESRDTRGRWLAGHAGTAQLSTKKTSPQHSHGEAVAGAGEGGNAPDVGF